METLVAVRPPKKKKKDSGSRLIVCEATGKELFIPSEIMELMRENS